ncbi:beta-lactamase class D/beta-lactamase class D OXA-42 [Devosia crocina]|uniref:Beta-lactamase n=1 Tax=Devosia crocina TaxID=429728 RepID=A0A1I7NUF1_9HYPH|nr:class D beta-lactamase [Devosia crocina]SFV38252.1 beta-lactamase class D/beta-lactamase class D OXA-42 [Devosia crocina]
MRLTVALFALLATLSAPAQARDICTLVADAATRTILLQQGDCETRVTPASTFKLPLAIMAWDTGIITAPTAPKLPFKPGYTDWGGAAWQQDTDPAMWMKHSTVWFSQRLAEQLGAQKLAAYAQSFGYGNADFSGDAGKNNGLERSWISSSLKISPLEQASFLAALVQGKLPVSPGAMSGAMALVQQGGESAGWSLQGKTGSAYPRLANGDFDRTQGWGWYVGWAEKSGQRLVFVRLAQDEQRHEVTGGLRAQQKLLVDWPALIAASGF